MGEVLVVEGERSSDWNEEVEELVIFEALHDSSFGAPIISAGQLFL